MSQIQVRDAAGNPVPLINVRLALGGGSSDDAYDDKFTDFAGNTAWPNPLSSPNGYTLYVNDRNVNPKYETTSLRVNTLSQDVPITLEAVPITLARLVRVDRETHRMVNERGEHVYGRGADAFLLYKKYLDGDLPTVAAVLLQLEDLGCNLIRVMGMFESLGGFNPKTYPDYYDSIVHFCAFCESYGIYVYWVACAATGGMFTPDEALQHTKRTADALVQTQNALFSYVNEQGQHTNSVDRVRFKAEVNTGWMLYDTGSFGMDLPCEPPFGTHAVLHVNRRYSNSVRDCCPLDNPNFIHDGLEVGIDEPDRYGDEGNTSVQQSGDSAGTAFAALLYMFHSMQGERADVMSGNTLDCAKAAFAAMKGR